MLPDTDVQLGTIHPRTKTKPRGPDTKRLLNRTSRVPVPAALYRTRQDPSVILEGGQLRSGGAGIDIHLPFLEGIGGKIGGEASTETVLYINAKDVETQWFQPDDAYFAQALKGVAIRKELLHFRRPSVFMVTGVKIAESATIVTGCRRDTGTELGPEIDLTPFGIPIEVGASINARRGDYHIVPVQKTKFLLAFETRRIRIKDEGYTEDDFNKFAFLDDETDGPAEAHRDHLQEKLSF